MSSSTTNGERKSVEQLAEEFLDRKRRGEPTTAEDYAQAHPELADEILGLFPALLSMETLGGDASSRTSTITSASESPAGGGTTPDRLGEYRIVREIGRGGMGVVYEAEQESLGRRVALKVLPVHLLADAKQVRRFQREARAAARLHHTNIVPVFGVGQHDGTHFYVMQFIEGQGLDVILEELKQLRTTRSHHAAGQETLYQSPKGREAADLAWSLATGRFTAELDGDRSTGKGGTLAPTASDSSPERRGQQPLPPEPATPGSGTESSISQLSETVRGFALGVARIGVQVADALAYAHTQRILHRDIKPSNLLLDRNGNVWVADFGLAKAADADDVTHTGDIVGTVRYMAPERFRGVADVRSDLYALGLSLYELLALRPAFQERDRASLIQQVTHDEPPRLRKLNSRVPLDLETIVHKAMAREPGQRYATAGALADDLRRFLDGRPIQARRSGAPERCWRWCKRNPVVAGLVTGIALLLVVGTAVSTFLAIRATANAHRADLEALRANQEKLRSEERLYVAELGLAQQAWREAEVDQMREHLELVEPHRPGDPDRRGFEWYYLRRLCDSGTRTLRGHKGEVWGLAFSPDGRRLVSACKSDGTLKIWDVGSGQLIRSQAEQLHGVGCPAYSADGRSIATACADAAVRLWDAASGARLRTLRGHSGWVNSLAFSPAGNRIASASTDQTVKIWDAKTGQEVRTLRGHSKSINRLAYGASGERLASASQDGTIKLWDTASGALLQTIEAHANGAWGVAFSPDGRRIATCGADSTVRLWDAASGQELLALSGHGGRVDTVAYSPDGRRLASSSVDGTVRLWDASSGQALQTLSGLAGTAHFVAFSPDGRRLASCDSEGSIKLWDVGSEQDSLTLRGHSGSVASVAFSPDGRRIASAGADRTVRLWDADAGQETRIFRGHVDIVYCVAFSPDPGAPGRLASAGRDQTVRLWDADSGQEVRILRGHTGWIYSLAFSPDGRRVASGDANGTARLWDAETGQEVCMLRGHLGAIVGLAFSPDGLLLASGSADRSVRLWLAGTGTLVRTMRGHGDAVSGVAFSPDGRRLASAGGIDGTVRLWDTDTGNELRALHGNMARINDVAFSPDGRRLAAAGGGSVKLWDAETGQPLLTLSGQAGTARGLAFGSDGRRLAAGVGPTVKLWDATSPTPELRTIREAVDLVEFLFSQHLPASEVLDRIRDDLSLGAEVRSRALDLAGRYGDRLLDREAERLVNGLYEKLLLRPMVQASLRADKTLSEPMRWRAVALAEQIPESPSHLNDASWSVVSKPGAAPEVYRLALKQAEAACQLVPTAGAMLNTLGVAQYRAERYREAVATLTESDRLNSEGALGAQPADLAFLALAHHRLAEPDKARTALDRLRASMKQLGRAGDPEAQSFLREAQVIELDLAFPSDPFTR